MSEFVEEEFLDRNWPGPALPEEGPAVAYRDEAAAIGRGAQRRAQPDAAPAARERPRRGRAAIGIGAAAARRGAQAPPRPAARLVRLGPARRRRARGGRLPLLGLFGAFPVDRRRLHRRAPVLRRRQGVGVRRRGSGRRQPACRRRRRHRPHRRPRLPRRACGGRGADGRGEGQRRQRRRSAPGPAGPDRTEPGPGRVGRGGARFRRAAGVALRRSRPARRGNRPERPAIFLGAAPAAGGGEERPRPR